jgi:nicotinate dehydrogenase subunit B
MATPESLAQSPLISDWLDFSRDGFVGIKTGKVEFGQGILTALRQIVAEELNVDLEVCYMIPASTAQSPNETFTAGSLSVQHSGSALRLASATARVLAGSENYWFIATTSGWEIPVNGDVIVKRPDEYLLVGQSIPRIDLDKKVQGKPAFIQDIRLENQLYARVLRPPSREATLIALNENKVILSPEIERIIVDGSFVAVIAHDEFSAQQIVNQLVEVSEWTTDSRGFSDDQLADFLSNAPADSQVLQKKGSFGSESFQHFARYSRPFVSHGSIGTVTAVAQWLDDSLLVWSQTQGVFPLRSDLARALNMEIDRITVTHAEGAGCYGHNGADDVAFDAALIARYIPGKPVMVTWTREDELGWAPFGPAMQVQLAAGLNESGSITHWSHTVRGNGHSSRPSTLSSTSLLAYAHIANGATIPPAGDPPIQRGGGTGRNSIPLYDLENCLVTAERLLDMPIRTSAMRALGAHINVFAIESFMDELALASNQDPIEFRLRHLSDPRGREVIARVAQISKWGKTLPEGSAQGIGFARYKNQGAWCAVVAQVEADTYLKVTNLWIAVDVGLVINPDGVINQIEGGALQSMSWTIKEEVRISQGRVISNNWEEYPILKFSEVPLIQTEIISRPSLPALGAGEASIGPTGAAIANALARAIDVRVRNMPLTQENIIASMEA